VKGAFEVLVATPGRLGQLVERKIVSLGDVRMMVLDEARSALGLGLLAPGR
jgi:ATP-dependent RNA helicase RhlE